MRYSRDVNLLTWQIYLAILFIIFASIAPPSVQCLEVIYAINAGGESHVDSNGVRYMRDPLMGKVGTASDYGKQLIIGRVNNVDQILYQTERYHHSTFGYDIPINKDGDYVMVLRFCEVYFNSPNMKVHIFKYSKTVAVRYFLCRYFCIIYFIVFRCLMLF